MVSRNKTNLTVLYSLLLLVLIVSVSVAEVPSYTEIPFYLKQLEQADLEEKRFESLKKIHDAIVNADLLDKNVVKQMEPMIARVMQLMDSGFDRAYIDGKSFYLLSAVDYFEARKLKPEINVPESDWMDLQSVRGSLKLSTYPDKILLHTTSTSAVIAVNERIHEAVISPDLKKVSYFCLTDSESTQAEIWTIDLKKNRQRRIAKAKSCYTILYSLKGDQIFFQEKPVRAGEESRILRVSSGGGKPKPIASGTLLQTIIKSGPYRGNLVIYKKVPHHWGATDQECPSVFSPNGREVGKIKNAACK